VLEAWRQAVGGRPGECHLHGPYHAPRLQVGARTHCLAEEPNAFRLLSRQKRSGIIWSGSLAIELVFADVLRRNTQGFHKAGRCFYRFFWLQRGRHWLLPFSVLLLLLHCGLLVLLHLVC
jgi:hypothetical protein